MKKQLENNKLKYEGLKSKTNEGYEIEIIEYRGYYNCIIKLYTDENKTSFLLVDKPLKIFKKGEIKNPYHKSVMGVGFVGEGLYKPSKDNKDTKEYTRWYCMLRRCYDKKYQEKHPTYKGCTVDERWHNFQVFAEWHERNYNLETMQGWHLDKDIVCKECKIYSPETCMFLPKEINNLFKEGKNLNSVRKKGNRFLSYLSINNKQEYLGSFYSKEEAKKCSKDRKLLYVAEIIEKFKDVLSAQSQEHIVNYYING